MIKKFKTISENQIILLNNLVGICNRHDKCNQVSMVENDTEFFPDFPKFYIYEHKDNIISFLSLFFIDESSVSIYGFTHPDYRRKGYLNLLFNTFIDDIKNASMDKTLTVFSVPIDSKNEIGLNLIKNTAHVFAGSECIMEYSIEDDCNFHVEDDVLTDVISDGTTSDYRLFENNDGIKGDYIGQLFCVINDGCASVYDVMIEPSYRGYGYSYSLMCSVINNLKNMGVKKILLNVTHQNVPAYNLYRKCGFIEVSSINYYNIKNLL